MMTSHMSVIAPYTVSDAMLTSSTAPETDYTAWNAATAYVAGNKCILVSTHRIYECLIGNTGYSPDVNLSGLTPKWLDIGPTNKWAMFDNVVGTQTAIASPLTVTLLPGGLSGLYLGELSGRQVVVTLKDAPAGATVYTRTISLDGTILASIYDWFYQPFVQQADVVLTDLPFHFPAGELTISITSSAASAGCGVCKFGEVVPIGNTEYGATSGIIDYSVKAIDAFGRYSVVPRAYAKRMSLKVVTEKTEYNRISRALAGLRSTLCVWIATDYAGYEPLIVYGFYKDFSIDVAYPTMHYCSLEIEGLI